MDIVKNARQPTSRQKLPFSYKVDDKALRTFTRAHFLQFLMENTRKGTRTFTVSWLRTICNNNYESDNIIYYWFLKRVEILTAAEKKTLQSTCFLNHLFCWLQLTHTRQILWVTWQVNLLRNNWVVENLSSVWLYKLQNPINFTSKIWFEIWFVLESLTMIRDKRVFQ